MNLLYHSNLNEVYLFIAIFSSIVGLATAFFLRTNKKQIIVYCKSGKGSAKVCEYLEHNNYTDVKNLSGGIIAWAEQIDSSILVY